jgi:fumarate reductase subunit D
MRRQTSSRSHALAWLLFGAGGTLTALLFPALIIAGLALALSDPSVAREGMHRAAVLLDARWARWGLVALVTFALWHAAHRIGLLLHDLRLPIARRILAPVLYVLAAAAAPIGLALLR